MYGSRHLFIGVFYCLLAVYSTQFIKLNDCFWENSDLINVTIEKQNGQALNVCVCVCVCVRVCPCDIQRSCGVVSFRPCWFGDNSSWPDIC